MNMADPRAKLELNILNRPMEIDFTHVKTVHALKDLIRNHIQVNLDQLPLPEGAASHPELPANFIKIGKIDLTFPNKIKEFEDDALLEEEHISYQLQKLASDVPHVKESSEVQIYIPPIVNALLQPRHAFSLPLFGNAVFDCCVRLNNEDFYPKNERLFALQALNVILDCEIQHPGLNFFIKNDMLKENKMEIFNAIKSLPDKNMQIFVLNFCNDKDHPLGKVIQKGRWGGTASPTTGTWGDINTYLKQLEKEVAATLKNDRGDSDDEGGIKLTPL